MPIYEYRCGQCDSTFEKLVKITDDSIQECPKCESTDVKREFSTFGIGGCPNTGAGGQK
ncbi:MAG: zinc ribbon domain-containing protein [Maledivibacter sp.]|jgi:putative FmdB family regulatory protein|nr:zinc ribbon domain-containing protein [Maledivibacter sp.]